VSLANDIVSDFDRRRLGPHRRKRLWIERLPCYETPIRHGYCPSVDVIDESDKVYLIMELMTGGNLLSKVVQQEGLCESTVKLIAKTL
jgi:hypothetical protein